MGETVATVIVSGGLYVGEHAVRLSKGRAYIHIPIKSVEGLISRRVKILARVNASKCEDKTVHGSILSFSATLVNAGGTYRVNLPSYYLSLASKIMNCGSLEVWLTSRG
jgi:hypothetical protein